MMRFITLALLIVGVSACERTTVIYPNNQPTNQPTNPTPIPPTNPVQVARIEFRVIGNATSATIRHSDSLNGITQMTSVLPYLTTWNSNQSSIFLSLEATPIGYPVTITSPFMAVQIFVNGQVFREAASSSFVFSTLSVNGTWRNGQLISNR